MSQLILERLAALHQDELMNQAAAVRRVRTARAARKPGNAPGLVALTVLVFRGGRARQRLREGR